MPQALAESFVDVSAAEAPVRGFLHLADPAGKDFLVLTHGAGGNAKAPLLVALSERIAAAGVTTLRCDLPYRQRRPTGPPSPSDAKHDQAGLRRAVALMRERFGGRAFLGGVSYGGRQASMLVAAEPSLVAACCFCLIRCIRPDDPNNSAPHICRSCAHPPCLSVELAMPSAPSTSSKPQSS